MIPQRQLLAPGLEPDSTAIKRVDVRFSMLPALRWRECA
jgi:hypothetical protein